MIVLGRLDDTAAWHVFVWLFQESLCGGIPLEDCVRKLKVSGPARAARVKGAVCPKCLRRLMAIARTGDALNERLP